MSEMVERVANAILGEVPQGYGMTKPEAREYARAAIAAMREPTEDQYNALSAMGYMWRDLDSRTVWQTYIDAALGPAEEPKPVNQWNMCYGEATGRFAPNAL